MQCIADVIQCQPGECKHDGQIAETLVKCANVDNHGHDHSIQPRHSHLSKISCGFAGTAAIASTAAVLCSQARCCRCTAAAAALSAFFDALCMRCAHMPHIGVDVNSTTPAKLSRG